MKGKLEFLDDDINKIIDRTRGTSTDQNGIEVSANLSCGLIANQEQSVDTFDVNEPLLPIRETFKSVENTDNVISNEAIVNKVLSTLFKTTYEEEPVDRTKKRRVSSSRFSTVYVDGVGEIQTENLEVPIKQNIKKRKTSNDDDKLVYIVRSQRQVAGKQY